MLKLIIGADWVANSDQVMNLIAKDVKDGLGGRILIVPELISHDTERRLCEVAGNTCSRFAEVLTFTRLAGRVSDSVGHGMLQCLDDGGRVVAMASAARQLRSKLKAYASVETKPEFLTGVVDAVDEFKRCCITPEDLLHASSQTDGVFAQKLEELALLFEAYDSLCVQGKRDPRDQMTWLLEQLEDSDFAQNHTFYIDGFPDFTRQHMAIVAHLIASAPNVVISINCDCVDTQDPAFEKASDTAVEILKLAKQAGVETVIREVPPRGVVTEPICRSLFQRSTNTRLKEEHCLKTFQAASIQEECNLVAEEILELVRTGIRFRDIGVVAADMASYNNMLQLVFGRFHIPFYTSGTESILEKSVIHTLLSALDVVSGGFEQADVLRFLKSPLSLIDMQVCDRIENYAIIWDVQGKSWFKTWENHPDGLSQQWTQETTERLQLLNYEKDKVLLPLQKLEAGFKSADNMGQMVAAVYSFLEDISLAEKLSHLAEKMDLAGDNQSAQVLDQLWEILLNALEQLHDVLGNSYWDQDTFTRLLRLLLGQYTVGTIPTVLDSVMVGPVSAMRCQRMKYLFVLGALEGSMPSYGGISGVLTDQERTALRQMGVPLTGGALDGLKTEFSEIYGVFCGASDGVCVSCPIGQPSFLFKRLADMSSQNNVKKESIGPALADPVEAAAFLLRNGVTCMANDLAIEAFCAELSRNSQHQLGSMAQDTVKQLYGSVLQLSASQVERFADCRLSYFLRYGLRAKERKVVQIDPAEFGTYVHWVLEKTVGEILQKGGFQKISLEDTLAISGKYSNEYEVEHFSALDSARNTYLFHRNHGELDMVVTELWQELQQSQFQPVACEVEFGTGCQMDPIAISGQTMQAQLRGFVDRIDSWTEDGRNYFRVVDYKTGKKDFDYCDVFNGLGLQMLLYLFALEHSGQSLLGEKPISAGVQYFLTRAPLIATEGAVSSEEAELARQKLWKRKGLLLDDEQILRAMEPGDKPVRLGYTRKKDGTISGDLADREQLRMLEAYINRLLGHMVDKIAAGSVDANPYTRGSAHNACAYCPYGAVCHPEYVEGRRDYKAMNAQRFWEEIGRELKELG